MLLDALRRELGGRARGRRATGPSTSACSSAWPSARPTRRVVPLVLAHRPRRGPAAGAVVLRAGGPARARPGRIPDPQTLEREAAAAGQARAGVAGARRPRARDRRDRARPGEPRAPSLGSARAETSAGAPATSSSSTSASRGRSADAVGALAAEAGRPPTASCAIAEGTREALAASRPTRARLLRRPRSSASRRARTSSSCRAICRLAPREEIAPLERLDPLTRGTSSTGSRPRLCARCSRPGCLPRLPRDARARGARLLDDTLDARRRRVPREAGAGHRARVAGRDRVDPRRPPDVARALRRGPGDAGSRSPSSSPSACPAAAGVDARERARRGGRWPGAGACAASSTWSSAGAAGAGSGSPITRPASTAPRPAWWSASGETLQPVLYGLAVEQRPGRAGGRVAPLLLHRRRRVLGARRRR